MADFGAIFDSLADRLISGVMELSHATWARGAAHGGSAGASIGHSNAMGKKPQQHLGSGPVPSNPTGVHLSAASFVAYSVGLVAVTAGCVFILAPPQQKSSSSSIGSIRHLFSTPLYRVNLVGNVDVAALSGLAMQGYNMMVRNKKLTKGIVQMQVKEHCPSSPKSEFNKCRSAFEKSSSLNDIYFQWQMGSGRVPTGMGDKKERNDYNSSPDLAQLKQYITNVALPRYMKSIGAPSTPPNVDITMWAGIMVGDAEHGEHEHCEGPPGTENCECLCSGVFYSSVPAGSGALKFSDTRKPTSTDFPSFFPGKSYHFEPQAGDLILFPPWQLHHVMPSKIQQKPKAVDGQITRVELQGLKLSALKKRLKRLKIKPTVIEELDDTSDPKTAAVELLLSTTAADAASGDISSDMDGDSRISWAFNVLTRNSEGKSGKATRDLHDIVVDAKS